MDCLLALWLLLLLVSLVTCNFWSFDLYLKKLPCKTVYILTQDSIKHPCSTRDLGSLSFLLSLSLYFWLIPWSVKAGCVTQGILASFHLSLSYHRLRTTRFWSFKGPQRLSSGPWNPQDHGCHSAVPGGTSGPPPPPAASACSELL